MLRLLVWILFTGLTLTSAATNSTSDTYGISKPATITKPGCPRTCGNLTVPYPFGIASGCALNADFELNCTDAYDPPQALIGNIQTFHISDSHARVSNAMARRCYDGSGSTVLENTASSDITGTPFSYSELNKFTIVGCDDFALFSGVGSSNITTGCFSICDHAEDVSNGDCSGKGCCQISTPKGMQSYLTAMGTLNSHTNILSFDPCGYAFFGEGGRFDFRGASDLSDRSFMLRVRTTVPVVLDWRIGNLNCAQVVNSADYSCKANSVCVDSDAGLGGYRCSCNKGYEGNPYLDPGCTDIDECVDSNLNDCLYQDHCSNTPGSFFCTCPYQQFGDGRKNGGGCVIDTYMNRLVAIGKHPGFYCNITISEITKDGMRHQLWTVEFYLGWRQLGIGIVLVIATAVSWMYFS